MDVERLAVEFQRAADGGVVLRVSGRLDEATAALLDGVLRALRMETAPVTIDLREVDHIDSHGLDVLLTAEADARRRNATMDVVGVRESLRSRRSLEE